MISGRRKITDWFEAKPDFPYWALYYRSNKASGQPIARMREQEEVTKNEGIQELEKHLNLLSRGTYSLTAMPGAKIKGRGSETVDFEITDGIAGYDGSTPQPAAPVVQGFTKEDVAAAVATEMAKYKAEVELENLKKELAELKRENKELQDSHEDPWGKIAGVVAPHLPGLLGLQQAGVAGVPELPVPAPSSIHHQSTTNMPTNENAGSTIQTDTEVKLSEADQNRLGEILGGFAEIDPDWMNTLDRMVKKGKANPSLISLLKSML